jgi:putative pyruvate formate lyase activating enzyme
VSEREWPAYLTLWRSGELRRRAEIAYQSLAACRICPRQCGVNRLAGQVGFCRAAADVLVASWNLHHGEEPPISGTGGSGTIFFSGCSGRCKFCQNYPISQLLAGRRYSIEELAGMMLELQRRGAHNINLVTGSHFVPQILLALDIAAGRGLRLPLIHNCSGYESVETLRWLDGVVDIYLPDAKYSDDKIAHDLSGFVGYVEANRAALREMFRQVGDVVELDERGVARRGLIIRHLVLPQGLAGSEETFRWVAANLSPHVYFSIMNQYFPAYQALDHPILGRKLSEEEYEAALEAFFEAGLHNGWNQGCDY